MTEFQDDPDILNDESLLRRVATNNPDMLKTDSVSGIQRPTSAAFSFQKDGLSVYRNKKLKEFHLNPIDILSGPDQIVVSLTVTQVRECNGLGVCDDPWPKGIRDQEHIRNAAHALIVGWQSLSRREQKDHSRYLARNCQIIDISF